MEMRTRFRLSFDGEGPARHAAAILDGRGFDVRVLGPDSADERWSVRAARQAWVPARGLGLTELRLGWLARRLGGRYDGREAASRP
jgi:hypothetical protein